MLFWWAQMQSVHACAVQTHFSVFILFLKNVPKRPPKCSLLATFLSKNRFRKPSEICNKKQTSLFGKSAKNTSKKGFPFRVGRVFLGPFSQWGPRWAPKPSLVPPGVVLRRFWHPFGMVFGGFGLLFGCFFDAFRGRFGARPPALFCENSR